MSFIQKQINFSDPPAPKLKDEHFPKNRGRNKGETRRPAKLAITGCGRLLSNKSSESPLISLHFGPTAAARMSGKMSGEYFWVGLWGPVGKVVTPAENATSRDNATMYTSVDTTRNVFFRALQRSSGGERLNCCRREDDERWMVSI